MGIQSPKQPSSYDSISKEMLHDHQKGEAAVTVSDSYSEWQVVDDQLH